MHVWVKHGFLEYSMQANYIVRIWAVEYRWRKYSIMMDTKLDQKRSWEDVGRKGKRSQPGKWSSAARILRLAKWILSILIPNHAISKNYKELVRFFHWKIKTDYCMEVSFKWEGYSQCTAPTWSLEIKGNKKFSVIRIMIGSKWCIRAASAHQGGRQPIFRIQ